MALVGSVEPTPTWWTPKPCALAWSKSTRREEYSRQVRNARIS